MDFGRYTHPYVGVYVASLVGEVVIPCKKDQFDIILKVNLKMEESYIFMRICHNGP